MCTGVRVDSDAETSQGLLGCVASPTAMASQPSELLSRRPLLVHLARGRYCRRASGSPGHASTPFASVSAASQANADEAARSEQTQESTSAKEAKQLNRTSKTTADEGTGPERFTSLVQLESEPLNTVMFPQWMVEAYQDLVTFGGACKRLFLPENGIKSKLPYYRSALQRQRRTDTISKVSALHHKIEKVLLIRRMSALEKFNFLQGSSV